MFREQVEGAHGSQLFRSREDHQEYRSLARWESWEDWQAFRKGLSPARLAVDEMASVSEIVSTEVFDEVEDLLARPGRACTISFLM